MGNEYKKLGEVCDVKKGTSITKTKVTDGSIPVIAGGQQPAYYHNIPNRTGKTVTISASGAYAGFVNYFEIPIFASDCTTIQSMDEDKLLTKYVFLMLKSQQKKVYSFQTGAGQPHVYAKDLAKIEIPVLPLPIQHKIVSILERAEKLKNLRQEANDETNTIIQALFYEMFGNEEKNSYDTDSLGSNCEILMGQSPSGKSYNTNHEGIPLLNGPAEFGKVHPLERQWTNKPTKICKSESILFCVRGATAGRLNIADKAYCIGRGLAALNGKGKLANKYIYEFLRIKYNYFQSIGQGSTFINIDKKMLNNLNIPIPPMSLQNQFASLVEKIESVKEHQRQSTQEISTLFDALMQKAFNGELVV